MECNKTNSELEDGEIRDDDFEDISDCSLSDILQEDLSDDNDIDSLRQEALKSLNNEDQMNEEEKYRLEALKSLLKNTAFLDENEESLHEVEDLTEEEKYRLEAIKSLLRNTDFLSTNETKSTTANTKKRKRRKRLKNRNQKRTKPDASNIPNTGYLKETTSLLSELSEDVKKMNKSLEIQKTEDSVNINKENDTKDDDNPVIDSVRSIRSWYPTTEFTLLDISSVQNIEPRHYSSDGDHKVNEREHSKRKEICNRKNSPRKCRKCDKILPQPKQLPEVNSVVDIPEVQSLSEKLCEPVEQAVITPQPQVEPTHCDPPMPLKSIKLPHVNLPLRPPPNGVVKSVLPKPNIPCHFRKFRTVLPPPKTFSYTRRKERYKINHLRNNSKYVLRKTTLKIDKTDLKLNKISKSRYSINHTKQFPQINPREFIIPLDEEDSSKEEECKPADIPESHHEISSSNIVAKIDQVVIKEEPMEITEESQLSSELPSTTTIEILSNSVKEETLMSVIATDTLLEPDAIEDVQSEEISSVKCETSDIGFSPPLSENNTEPETKETDLLYEAEANLIEIRSKLLSSLDELDDSMKQNSKEKEKLLTLVRKLNLLKATIQKFEDKIRTQRMKLAMSNSFMRSLFEGVTLRSKTCSKMKDLCTIAGKKIIGPQYRPPEEFEAQIEEKQKTVDFSKYVQSSKEKK